MTEKMDKGRQKKQPKREDEEETPENRDVQTVPQRPAWLQVFVADSDQLLK